MIESYGDDTFLLYNPRKEGNKHFLIVGEVGTGKTVFTNRLIRLFLKCGYKVIVVADVKKDKGCLESAFLQFPVTEGYHKRALINQREKVEIYPVRVYHPFTFKIPSGKIPETNFFTISIKTISEEEIKFLLEIEDTKSVSFRMLFNAINNLKEKEGTIHLLHNLRDMIERKKSNIYGMEISSADPDRYYLKGVSSGQITNVDELASILPFENHFYIMQDDFRLNLDIARIMNDRETVSVFTTRYIKDSIKQDDFVTFWLMNQIEKNIEKCKYPLLVVFPEIKVLCPKKSKGHKIILKNTFSRFLSTIRNSNCSSISNTQIYSQTDETLANLFNKVYFGRVSAMNEIGFLSKEGKIGTEVIGEIRFLNRGEFISLSDMEEQKEGGTLRVYLPPFANNEEHNYYDSLFKRYFPERMENYDHLKKEITDNKREEIEHFKKISEVRSERDKQAILSKIKEKEKILKEKEEIELLKQKKKEVDSMRTEERDRLIIELSNKGLSSRKISIEMLNKYGVKISHMAISNIIKKQQMV